MITVILNNLKEHIPVKQGLRPSNFLIYHFWTYPQRAYSSKTRIKTSEAHCYSFPLATQRAYSSKTRIKTQGFTLFIKVYHFLKEHIPVKQGLRLFSFVYNYIVCKSLKEHIPVKQGLRRYKYGRVRTKLLVSKSIFQ